jgi:hypothetical protein
MKHKKEEEEVRKLNQQSKNHIAWIYQTKHIEDQILPYFFA